MPVILRGDLSHRANQLTSRSLAFTGLLICFLHMYLFHVFVELPLHGFHCCSRISGQSGPAKTKVRVAT